jgi:transposase
MSDASPPDLPSLLERIERLEGELALAKDELKRKDQIIAGLQHRLFGSKSERLDPAQLQLLLDELALGKPEPPAEDDGDNPAPEEADKEKGPRSRRTKAERFPKNLRVVVEEERIPEEVRANPEEWVEYGEEFHDELEVTRPEMFWRRTVLKKFRHRDRSRPPVIAPAPAPSIPGTLCGPNLGAQIVVDKYADHLPHYRQSRRFQRKFGVELGRQTINGWTHSIADFLRPVDLAIRNELFEAEVMEVDETPGAYLDPGQGKTGQGYLWAYLDPLAGTTYFDWQAGRGHDCLLDILGFDEETGTTNFRGIIHCDGFSAYLALVARYGGIRLAGCLAHIRRKFVEARDQAPEVVLPILKTIQEIYFIEKQTRWANAPPGCRELVRRARARPLADVLYQTILAERTAHLPKSKLGEALTYALNQWEQFSLCLEDGRLELDTNFVENAIRPAKLGLKNYLFMGSLEAGATSALFYTLLANCKVHDLDPEIYLAEVIRRLPANATPEQAAALTPARFASDLRAAQQAA